MGIEVFLVGVNIGVVVSWCEHCRFFTWCKHWSFFGAGKRMLDK